MSRRKGEPVKNTCPDIDRIISAVLFFTLIGLLRGFLGYDPIF